MTHATVQRTVQGWVVNVYDDTNRALGSMILPGAMPTLQEVNRFRRLCEARSLRQQKNEAA